MPCCIQPYTLPLTSFMKWSSSNSFQSFNNLNLSEPPSCLSPIPAQESNGRMSKLILWCNIFSVLKSSWQLVHRLATGPQLIATGLRLPVAQFAKNQKDWLWTGCNQSFWGPVAWPMIPPFRGIYPILFIFLSIYLNLLEYFLSWLLQRWHTMRNQSYLGLLWTKFFDFWVSRRPGASSIFYIYISKR